MHINPEEWKDHETNCWYSNKFKLQMLNSYYIQYTYMNIGKQNVVKIHWLLIQRLRKTKKSDFSRKLYSSLSLYNI